MSVIEEIVAKLQKELETQDVQIEDFSEEHAGHHFRLVELATNLHLKGKIRSVKFQGLSRVNKERLVNTILSAELQSGVIHALSLVLEE